MLLLFYFASIFCFLSTILWMRIQQRPIVTYAMKMYCFVAARMMWWAAVRFRKQQQQATNKYDRSPFAELNSSVAKQFFRNSCKKKKTYLFSLKYSMLNGRCAAYTVYNAHLWPIANSLLQIGFLLAVFFGFFAISCDCDLWQQILDKFDTYGTHFHSMSIEWWILYRHTIYFLLSRSHTPSMLENMFPYQKDIHLHEIIMNITRRWRFLPRAN